jgi:hypothetical protein
MRTPLSRWWTPGCGIGSVVLFTVHALVHGSLPAQDASAAQLLRYASRHHAALLASAWLDGLATALLVLFVAGILGLAGRTSAPAAAVTLAGAGMIASLILFSDVFFVTLAQAGRDGQATLALTAWRLLAAINLIFPAANMLWLTGLAALVLYASVVPRALAYLGLALGLAEVAAGPAGLATGSTTLDNSWFSLAGLWVIAAALTLGARHPAPTSTPTRSRR